MKGAKSKSDAPKKADSKLSVKKKAAKPSQKPSQKADKDPNKPKRPPSAFFVFMEEFRKQFKEKHPNVKQVSVVGKAGGEKWKSLSAAEKAPYEAKAAKLKTEYGKKMDAYNNKDSRHGAEDYYEASDKSKSELHDDDDDEYDSAEEDEDDE